jgi:hypothetical protein
MLVKITRTVVTTMEFSDDERTEQELKVAVAHRLTNARATQWTQEGEDLIEVEGAEEEAAEQEPTEQEPTEQEPEPSPEGGDQEPQPSE